MTLHDMPVEMSKILFSLSEFMNCFVVSTFLTLDILKEF